MKKVWQAGLLSAVMLGSLGAAAVQAQSFYFNTDNGYHHFYGDRDNDRFRESFGNGYGYFNPWRRQHNFERIMVNRQSQVYHRIAQLRGEINERLSEGSLSQGRAYRLNARLDQIANDSNAAVDNRMMTDGMLDRFEARLNNVQAAMSGGGWGWY